jgi:hypothetical protein
VPGISARQPDVVTCPMAALPMFRAGTALFAYMPLVVWAISGPLGTAKGGALRCLPGTFRSLIWPVDAREARPSKLVMRIRFSSSAQPHLALVRRLIAAMVIIEHPVSVSSVTKRAQS